MSNFEKLKSTEVTRQITGMVLLLECLHTSALHRQNSSLSQPTFNDPTHTHTHTPVGSNRFQPLRLQPCVYGVIVEERGEVGPPITGKWWGQKHKRRQFVQSVHTAEFSIEYNLWIWHSDWLTLRFIFTAVWLMNRQKFRSQLHLSSCVYL